ncbi:MAG: hypothetical protein K8R25_02045, partial [Methanosarcinales archaeon]|nr:hypothetical protein [Methanosarcinales archaeon]
ILVPPKDLKYAQVCKKVAKDTSYGSETYKPYLDIKRIINIQSAGSINRGHDPILELDFIFIIISHI